MNRKLNEKGNALVELLLMLPVFLVMSLWGIEYGLILETKQKLATLNKETAHSAYRLCAYSARDEEVQCCLSKVAWDIFSTSKNVFRFGGTLTDPLTGEERFNDLYVDGNKPNFTVLVSAYRADTAGNITRIAATAFPPSAFITNADSFSCFSSDSTVQGISSIFDASHSSITSLLDTSATGKNTVVVSEMSYPYVSFTGALAENVGLDFTRIRDVSIF